MVTSLTAAKATHREEEKGGNAGGIANGEWKAPKQ